MTPRRCALGTMHGKERAIGPAVLALGLEVVVPPGLDTDALGTFTGEVPRPGVLEALRAKARMALARAPAVTFAAASEGTFGMHPDVPLLVAGTEHVLLLHAESGVEVVGLDVTLDTNAGFAEVGSVDEAAAFAARAGFPAHGLIVRGPGVDGPVLARGVLDPEELQRHVARTLAARGAARVEADMRAHVNPTRMAAIARAAADAVERWRRTCPGCDRPGFSPTGVVRGLPCAGCGEPTDWVLATTLRCAGCGHAEQRPRSDGRTVVDPGNCGACNP